MTDQARAETPEENLREWVATTLNVFLAPADLEASAEAIDTLTQVIECRAKEIAALDAAEQRGAARGGQDLLDELVELGRDLEADTLPRANTAWAADVVRQAIKALGGVSLGQAWVSRVTQSDGPELSVHGAGDSPLQPKVITMHVCGGKQADICPVTKQPHDMSAVVRFNDGGSVACKDCGVTAMEIDMLRLP